MDEKEIKKIANESESRMDKIYKQLDERDKIFKQFNEENKKEINNS